MASNFQDVLAREARLPEEIRTVFATFRNAMAGELFKGQAWTEASLALRLQLAPSSPKRKAINRITQILGSRQRKARGLTTSLLEGAWESYLGTLLGGHPRHPRGGLVGRPDVLERCEVSADYLTGANPKLRQGFAFLNPTTGRKRATRKLVAIERRKRRWPVKNFSQGSPASGAKLSAWKHWRSGPTSSHPRDLWWLRSSTLTEMPTTIQLVVRATSS